jgi:CheY-like chemotaxis protein
MKKVLIAEDDPTNQKIIAKFVDRMGFISIVSPNGRHAYETLSAYNNINLVVTDIMMPEMDGRQLIQTIRGNTNFKKLPIIIISAVLGVSDISDLLEIGATYFLAKPIKRNDFEEYVHRCLK